MRQDEGACSENLSLVMSKRLRDVNGSTKRNESGPDYLGYYKQHVSDLLSQEDFLLSGFDFKPSIGACSTCGVAGICSHNKVNSSGGSVSLFSRGIVEGQSEFKKERLKAVLDESVVCINQEVDEVLDQIIELFQIESDVRERELLSYCSGAMYDDIKEPFCGRKRKASSLVLNNPISNDDTSNSRSVIQVYKNIQAIQGDGEISSEAVEKYSIDLCSQLGKMEHDLEVYINSVVSNSRLMTHAEKYQLSQRIQKLPDKALDRVIELVQLRNLSARKFSNEVPINFEEEDNITLWRLYYYVETVMKANEL